MFTLLLFEVAAHPVETAAKASATAVAETWRNRRPVVIILLDCDWVPAPTP
ncbi:hypothetical protein I6A60_22210 [Frankia sp. AgB1.9]|uniref:hypothetical protein n=1 Tax=unclassified Frankia TaxID=2632575 RepID=UPI0019336A1B|nr:MULTISPECIES: hypothetical protein [unclassified Frankia]MBL7489200.1 hypothetical protein [Frankia sp. AgW1.1]MBL7550563.1 hypothetical protein [Frankia sp. AgB1.9]MBL7620786.1 hypothetical protein [Frankia sp. AgB1.8]